MLTRMESSQEIFVRSTMNKLHHDHHQKTSASPPKMPSPNKNISRISPPVVELAKCNQHKFWRSVTRSFKSFLTTCFKPMDEHSTTKHSSTEAAAAEISVVSSLPMSPNYYTEMNDEERAEKLKSAIVYCKTTTTAVQRSGGGSG